MKHISAKWSPSTSPVKWARRSAWNAMIWNYHIYICIFQYLNKKAEYALPIQEESTDFFHGESINFFTENPPIFLQRTHQSLLGNPGNIDGWGMYSASLENFPGCPLNSISGSSFHQKIGGISPSKKFGGSFGGSHFGELSTKMALFGGNPTNFWWVFFPQCLLWDYAALSRSIHRPQHI